MRVGNKNNWNYESIEIKKKTKKLNIIEIEKFGKKEELLKYLY